AWWIPLRSAFVPAKEEPGKAHPEAVFMCLTRQAPPLGPAVKPFLVLQGLGVKSVRVVHVVPPSAIFCAAATCLVSLTGLHLFVGYNGILSQVWQPCQAGIPVTNE